MCGEIGLPPSEFYGLLYSELVLILDGYRARRKYEARERREESAWIVSWLMLPHKSRDADPEVFSQAWLLGRISRGKIAQEFATDAEAARAYFAAKKAQSKKRLTDGK